MMRQPIDHLVSARRSASHSGALARLSRGLIVAFVTCGLMSNAAAAKKTSKSKVNSPATAATSTAPAATTVATAATKSATSPAQSPVALIASLSARVDVEAAQKRSLSALHDALSAMIHAHMDYDEMGRRALGDEVWNERSAADRKTFLDLLAAMVERTYVKRFKPGKKVKVEIEDKMSVGKQARVRVRTIVRVDGTRADVAYSLRLVDERWRIYDIVVDEASQLSAYRKSFRKILAEEGWNGLMARMRKSAAR